MMTVLPMLVVVVLLLLLLMLLMIRTNDTIGLCLLLPLAETRRGVDL